MIARLWHGRVPSTKADAYEDRARYYPGDDEFLLEREPAVVHDDVAAGPAPG